jgi:hypothetical protein
VAREFSTDILIRLFFQSSKTWVLCVTVPEHWI